MPTASQNAGGNDVAAIPLFYYRKNRMFQKKAIEASLFDAETEMPNRKSLMEALENWTEKEKPFTLIYVGFENYNQMTELCTLGQKKRGFRAYYKLLKANISGTNMLWQA